MKRKLYLFLILSSLNLIFLSAIPLENKTLITIHGFMGASWNMYYMGYPFEKEGMRVIHWDYPSRDKTIKAHAEDLVIFLQAEAEAAPNQPINFLTHSMGGLVLRAALNHPDCPLEAKIGRAVLLAPPNQGAYWGRFIGRFSFVRYFAKDQSGEELMTALNFDHLGQFPESMEVMVIAGNFGLNPFIPYDNDGEVAVDETILPTKHRHIVLGVGHKTIIFSSEAASLTKNFFQEEEMLFPDQFQIKVQFEEPSLHDKKGIIL